MRAVGGADLDQLRAGARHDVGHAERAADLDQLAARDDRLAPARERVEHEQHRGGVVVDDGRVLGAGQFAQQAAHMIVALAAPAAAEIEFERHRVAHGRDRGFDRLLGEQRAAEIGVQHRAGEVEHRPQARRARPLRAAPARPRWRRPPKGPCVGAGLSRSSAHGVDRRAATVAADRDRPRPARASPRRPRGAFAMRFGVRMGHVLPHGLIRRPVPILSDHALIAEQERVALSMTPSHCASRGNSAAPARTVANTSDSMNVPLVRLTSLAHGGGCGCKLAPSVLQQLLADQPAVAPFRQLLVGIETGDDAAVWQLDDDTCVIATTDFFMPMVDDPFDFGRIAATNAISDVYAMGGRPIMALAILGMPVDKMAPEMVREILAAGRRCAPTPASRSRADIRSIVPSRSTASR